MYRRSYSTRHRDCRHISFSRGRDCCGDCYAVCLCWCFCYFFPTADWAPVGKEREISPRLLVWVWENREEKANLHLDDGVKIAATSSLATSDFRPRKKDAPLRLPIQIQHCTDCLRLSFFLRLPIFGMWSAPCLARYTKCRDFFHAVL